MDHIRVHEQREQNGKRDIDPRGYLHAAWVAFVMLVCVGIMGWLALYYEPQKTVLEPDRYIVRDTSGNIIATVEKVQK